MRTKAIILKKQATNEYDQFVTCYTEEFGKITAIAKSILKPTSIQAMHLDLFNLVSFDLINGRGIPIITGAQSENNFLSIKNNLPSLAISYFFAETADKLFFDYQKDEDMWNFLISLFEELNRGLVDTNKFLKSKQIEFLGILGYAPNLNECAFCSTKINGQLTTYSTQARGAICQDCFFSGHVGIVLKDGNWQNSVVIGALFEGLAERKLNSLNLINNVLK